MLQRKTAVFAASAGGRRAGARIEAMAQERTARLSASPPLFENRFLDFFSRIHPAVPALVFVPVIALLVWLGADDGQGALEIVLLLAGGVALWTLAEYWLHRKFFHWEPDNAIGRRMHFIIHGVHHDHPNDKLRLVMPPGASIPLAALFFGALLPRLRAADRVAAVRRLSDRVPRLRLHPLLRPSLRAEERPRQAATRTAHAASLPGSPVRVRCVLTALGCGVPHPAAQPPGSLTVTLKR